MTSRILQGQDRPPRRRHRRRLGLRHQRARCWPVTWRRTFPGKPTIIVQNQPGAGSLTMTNALYNNGPFDGTIIGASFSGMPTTPLL